MGKPVLVAYATKHGATAEIAGRIGSVTRQAGLETDVMPVGDVADISRYDAVIIGSAVYIGSWRKEASKFLKTNEAELKTKKVWFFSTGPTGEGDAEELLDGWKFPIGLLPVAERIGPVGVAVFHGALDTGKLSGFEKWIIKRVHAAAGDFREWGAIDEWARAVSEVMVKSG